MDKSEKYINDYLFFQEGPGVRNYQYTTSGVKLLNVSNLVDGKLDLDNSSRYISNEEANGKYKHFLCDAGDLIIASSGIKAEYFDKKMGFVNENMLPLCMNTSTIRFKSLDDSKINIKYFMYYLKSNHFKKQLEYNLTGSAQLNFGPSHLKKMKFVYHDISTQKIIVDKLDSIMSVINLKKEQLGKFDELIKSQFVEMFGDPNFNEKKWITRTVNDIGLCVAGATPSTAIKEYWENGTIPWLSSGEVNKGRIYETDTKISQKGYDNASTKLVPPKTVLIAMAGQGKTRGLSAITEIELCTNQSVCSIVNNDKVNPEYLLYFFKMQYLELRNASTSSEGRGGLNLKIIGNYKVMIPPIELQNKFAKIVEQIDKQKFVNANLLQLLVKNLKRCYNNIIGFIGFR